MFKGFKEFLFRGNVVDLAVAVVIGTAFTAVVTSFTTSFLEPLIALLAGGGVDGGEFEINGQVFTWGAFVNQVITFILIAAVVYVVIVAPMKRLQERRRQSDQEVKEAISAEVELLSEIRDLLRTERGDRT